MGRKLQAAIMAADSTYPSWSIRAGSPKVQSCKSKYCPKARSTGKTRSLQIPGARVTGNVGRPEEDPGNRTRVLWKNSMLP